MLGLKLLLREVVEVDLEHVSVVSFSAVMGHLLRGNCASIWVVWEEVCCCLVELKALDQAVPLTCISVDSRDVV
jgi:hypothetical protein